MANIGIISQYGSIADKNIVFTILDTNEIGFLFGNIGYFRAVIYEYLFKN